MTSQIALAPLTGTFEVDPVHSSITFGIRHMGVSTYRAGFADVAGRLAAEEDGVSLEGRAVAASVTITAPPEFRAHVLGPDFLDVERHPAIEFRSSGVELADDGSARVQGELTLRGVTRPLTATGTWSAPVVSPVGRHVALELEAGIDRREFGIDWQMQMPGGGDVLGYDVTIAIALELVAREA